MLLMGIMIKVKQTFAPLTIFVYMVVHGLFVNLSYIKMID